MNKPRVFVTRKLSPQVLAPLHDVAEVEIWPEDLTPPARSVLLEKVPHLEGLLTLLTDPMDATMIQALSPTCKVISQMAVGVDNIDLAAASARGIPVGHTPGVLTESCADFTWALLTAAARRVAEGDREVRHGIWRPWGPSVLLGADISGATLGIIGFGRIGQAVARRARGFGMRILYNDLQPNPAAEQELAASFVALDELLAQSDFISVHTFLSKETYHFIDREKLQKMNPAAILINTSRGPVVDPDALIWALQNHVIAGAALDVFEPEPIPADSPLLKLDNVVITPHIASASNHTRRRMAEIAVQNLLAGLRGERLPFCANPQVYG